MTKLDLDACIQKYNTEDILSEIIHYQFNSFSNDDTDFVKLECLASKALREYVISSQTKLTKDTFLTLLESCQDTFTPMINSIFEEAIRLQNAPDKLKDAAFKSMMMQLKNTYSRGDGYLDQLVSFSNKLYGALDTEFQDTLGFTYTTYQELLVFIARYYSKIIDTRNNLYRLSKSFLYKTFNQTEIDNIISFLGIKIGIDPVQDIEGLNPLYPHPIIDFGEYIYLPLVLSTLMNLPKVFHYTFVATKTFNKTVVAKYTKHRGDLVEDITIDLLSKFFSKDKIYHSLKYPTKDDYEADVTAYDNDICLLCECKSKILTLPALKGKTSNIDKDIHDAIGFAYEQALRTLKWIEQGNSFISKENNATITFQKPKKYFLICVTAENFGVIPYELEKYITIDTVTPIIPIVINIYDFEILIKESSSQQDFLNYLEFREKNYKLLSSLDELDVFGLYKHYGNIQLRLSASQLTPMGFSEAFDKKYNLQATKWLLQL